MPEENLNQQDTAIKEQAWPPVECSASLDKFQKWAAWYSGDPENLIHAYRSGSSTLRNLFWSRFSSAETRAVLHVPIASDIAGYSANQIFGEPPAISVVEAQGQTSGEAFKTQERLEEILTKGNAMSVFMESGETASSMGGAYIKIDLDEEVAPYPILSNAQPDLAFPKFKFKRYLVEVRLIKLLQGGASDITYLRQEEKHEKGKVSNFLWEGTSSSLGRKINLKDHPETESLEDVVETGIDDILVRYIPNRLPNRLWRGSPLGISDYSGIEPLMDQLDELYTAWMDEIRAARHRILMPESWLQLDKSTGRFTMDKNQSVYAALPNMGMSGEGDERITMTNFAIRSAQYKESALELMDRIVTSAGYSPQSFGLGIKGSAESGTALKIRERKSFQTKARKEVYFKEPLEDLMGLLLAVDKEHFKTEGINPALAVSVTFADSVQETIAETADALDKINRAEAMSIDTKVRLLHPDWSEDQVTKEVEAIKAEGGMGVEDPLGDFPPNNEAPKPGEDVEKTPDDEGDAE